MTDIQQRRKNAGLTQVEVARRLGINRSTVAQWEIGVSLPRAEKLPVLAALYGCKIEDLLHPAPPTR